ncbi:hypothetical protein GCM10023235_66530 [Kitasatospora terrestris]|uniref:Uncharacterized protein n=1 Tax=Kitasatospora terrestris TaxID=258051 RepID=A0ABP9EF46_9ACTN
MSAAVSTPATDLPAAAPAPEDQDGGTGRGRGRQEYATDSSPGGFLGAAERTAVPALSSEAPAPGRISRSRGTWRQRVRSWW